MPPPFERSSNDMAHPDVRLGVRGFGPISEAEVDLRPLTVFVGPSNAGKTYLATLIYALHRAADGFASVPRRGEFITQRLGAMDARVADLAISDARKKLLEVGRPFTCGDLPEPARAGLRDMLASVVTELEAEIERCFDVDRCSELARAEGPDGGFRVALSLGEGGRALWDVRMNVPRQGELQQEGHVHDLVLVPAEATATERQDLVSGSREEPRALFEALIDGAAGKSRERRVRQMPAARSGVVQSHRVIASSLVARSTRGRAKGAAEIATLSGVIADFVQRLILHDEGKPQSEAIRQLADALEHDPIGGEIRVRRGVPGGYPDFVYRPEGTTHDIRLSRASAMVTELAPLVLLLRGGIDVGDTLIIEELEAHLHPAAQTRMADALGRLVRAGVRVVVTTHSDWLLKEVGNLMRQGDLVGDDPESTATDTTRSWLKEPEVGVWLFGREDAASGFSVKEIGFDRTEGVEPDEYEDVAEVLYNRSAELQNRLQERSGRRNLHGD